MFGLNYGTLFGGNITGALSASLNSWGILRVAHRIGVVPTFLRDNQ